MQSELVSFLPSILVALAAGAVLVLLMGRKKLTEENARLTERLTAAEAAATVHRLQPARAAETPRKEKQQSEPQSAKELLSLRRDLAHAKDEVKRLSADLRTKDAAVAEARQANGNEIHVLKEQIRALTEQLRESVQRPAPKPQTHDASVVREAIAGAPSPTAAAAMPTAEAREARAEAARVKEKLNDVEGRARSLESRNRELEGKLSQIQSELRRWQDAGTQTGGKPLDPVMFTRWKERALEGRRMYQLMRQLRELSDAKLRFYQSVVEALSAHVLRKERGALPTIPPGKVAADVPLAAAAQHLNLERTLPADLEADPQAPSETGIARATAATEEAGTKPLEPKPVPTEAAPAPVTEAARH